MFAFTEVSTKLGMLFIVRAESHGRHSGASVERQELTAEGTPNGETVTILSSFYENLIADAKRTRTAEARVRRLETFIIMAGLEVPPPD